MSETLSPIEETYSTHEFTSVGNKREVLEIHPQGINGKMGEGVFVKERFSESELEILEFLRGTGISEEIIAYDNKKIAVKKVNGVQFDEYKKQFEKHAKTRKTDLDVDDFTFESITEIDASDNIIETDEAAANFCSSFLARNLFLTMNGVFHDDIKHDNIVVIKDEPIIIDFGAALLVEGGNFEKEWIENWEKVFIIIADMHSNFSETLIDFRNNRTKETDKHALGYASIQDLYKQFENVPLIDRPKIVSKFLNDTTCLDDLLADLRIPEKIQHDIITDINRLIDLYQ